MASVDKSAAHEGVRLDTQFSAGEERPALIEEIFGEALVVGSAALEGVDLEEAPLNAIAATVIVAVFERLADAGYRLCPPGKMLMPQSVAEARGMNLLSEAYLRGLDAWPEKHGTSEPYAAHRIPKNPSEKGQ